MRKIFYIAITFIICRFLNLQQIWVGFVPFFLLLNSFKTDEDFLWEVPLAALVCDVLLTAFPDETGMLIYVLAVTSAVILSVVSGKKLLVLFPAIILSVTTKNIHSVALLWAGVWYGIRTAFGYFTTKLFGLQEYKS